MKLGKTIAQIRKEQGMTQQDLGDLFHVTRQTVSNWENEKSYPDLETLVAISDHFSISLDMLLKEDTHMIQTIDKERHAGKRLAKTLIAITAILALCCAGYCAYWTMQKTAYETALDAAIESHGFSQKILTDSNGGQFATGSYTAQDGNICYTLVPPDFPALTAFSPHVPDNAKTMTARIEKDGQTLDLRISPTDVQDEDGKIAHNERFATLTLNKGFTENSDGTSTPVLSPEYSLDENGQPYAGHLDDETQAAYESMQHDVKTALKTMNTILGEIYA